MTYRYREFPVPGIFHIFGGIGTGIGKIWYRKKVSEPVSKKFGTGKSLGTGIGKIWYRKKVPEPVSEKFGTGKRSRNRYRKNLVLELIFVAKMFVFGTFIVGTGTGTGNFSFFLVVSESVSEKFGTGANFCCQNFGILKNYNG